MKSMPTSGRLQKPMLTRWQLSIILRRDLNELASQAGGWPSNKVTRLINCAADDRDMGRAGPGNGVAPAGSVRDQREKASDRTPATARPSSATGDLAERSRRAGLLGRGQETATDGIDAVEERPGLRGTTEGSSLPEFEQEAGIRLLGRRPVRQIDAELTRSPRGILDGILRGCHTISTGRAPTHPASDGPSSDAVLQSHHGRHAQ